MSVDMIILVLCELIMGAIVGFILCDNKRGLSMDEIKFSTILFVLANAFVFWKNPDAKAIIFAHMAISWFIVMIGVIMGEMLKLSLIKRIIRTVRKKDIQLAVDTLVRIAAVGVNRRRQSDKDKLDEQLLLVHSMLAQLIAQSKGLKGAAYQEQIQYLDELCGTYAALSKRVWDDLAKGVTDEGRLRTWTEIGDELTGISWDALNHAEENVKQQLSKAFSMRAIHRALKS